MLFTGKGGVGKTTMAAATAVRSAARGRRTVVISCDPAHSLADAFGTDFGSVGAALAPKLWGQQLDAQQMLEEAWGPLQDYMERVLGWAGVDGIEAEELSLLPGLEEVFSLAEIAQLATSGQWDTVVVDCAPTAETVRLLSLPDVLRWYMDRLFPAQRRITRLVAPALTRLTRVPVAGEDVFGSVEAFYNRIKLARELLTDPVRTSVRLVVNPEKLVVAEARRTFSYLSLYGYCVDMVISNRVWPAEVSDPRLAGWNETQREYQRQIHDDFAPVECRTVGLAREEVVGVAALRQIGSELYGRSDPARALRAESPMKLSGTGNRRELSVRLPFVDRGDLEVGQVGSDLFVRVGPYRRAVALPDSLRRFELSEATLRDETLHVVFSSADAARESSGATRVAAARAGAL